MTWIEESRQPGILDYVLLKIWVSQQKPSQAPAEQLERETSLAAPPTTTTTTAAQTTTATTTEMSSPTTFSPSVADIEAAGPSTARFDLRNFLEHLKEEKLAPRAKFVKIMEEAGPVRLPYETLVLCLNVSQRKNGRARNMQIYEAVLATYKEKTQE